MTTRDVMPGTGAMRLDGDSDAILSDYAPDAIVATPDGVGSEHDYIRAELRGAPSAHQLAGTDVLDPGAGRRAVPHLSVLTATAQTSSSEPTHS